ARADVGDIIGQSSRGATVSRRSARVRDTLVVSQIAATLLLFVSALVLIRSFVRLQRVDPGFDASGVLTAFIDLPREKYPTDGDVADVSRRYMESIRRVPQVEA